MADDTTDVSDDEKKRDAALKAQNASDAASINVPSQAQVDQTRQNYRKSLSDEISALSTGPNIDPKYTERMKRLVDAEGATADDLKPWNAQQEQAKTQTSLWDEFGSPAFIIAMLGSAFAANPMNAALNSGAAAIQAAHQRNDAEYEKNFKAWQANTDLALKRLDAEHQEISSISELQKTNFDEWQAKMRTLLAKYGDEGKLALLDGGMLSEFNDAVAGVYSAKNQMEQAQLGILQNEGLRKALLADPRFAKGSDIQGALNDAASLQLKPEDRLKRADAKSEADAYAKQFKADPNSFYALPPAQQLKVRASLAVWHPDINIPDRPEGGYLKAFGISPEEANTLADYQRLTGKAPQLGWGAQMNQVKLELSGLAAQRARDGVPIDDAAKKMAAEQAGYAGQVSGARQVGGRAAKVVLASNLEQFAIPQALDASRAFPRGKWVPINAANIKLAEAGSSVSLTTFDIANMQVAEGYARLLNPQGNVIRKDFFDRAINQLSQAKSPEAYEAALRAIWASAQKEKESLQATSQEMQGENVDLPDPFAKPGGGDGWGNVTVH